MKLNSKTEPAFKPVEFTITFETQEEINLIHKLMKRNVTVPSVVYGHYAKEPKEQQQLSTLMGSISNALNKHVL
jgi:hypothetical protein